MVLVEDVRRFFNENPTGRKICRTVESVWIRVKLVAARILYGIGILSRPEYGRRLLVAEFRLAALRFQGGVENGLNWFDRMVGLRY